MKRIIDTTGLNTTTFGFSADMILRLVYAQSALRALASDAAHKRPYIFDDDNRELLTMVLKNGFITIATTFMGYISAYDIDAIDEGDCVTFEFILPRDYDPSRIDILRQKLEIALAAYVLAEVYKCDSEYDDLYRDTAQEYRSLINDALAYLSLI